MAHSGEEVFRIYPTANNNIKGEGNPQHDRAKRNNHSDKRKRLSTPRYVMVNEEETEKMRVVR